MNSLGKPLVTAMLAATLNVAVAHAADLPRLQVSDNHRFLAKEDGTPLVWIGDTLWNWHKLRPAELDEYLDKRVAQGFTVIQTQVAALGRVTYNGDWCFGGVDHKDITHPQEPFWQYSDEWLEKIEDRGLYVALGLSWIVNYWNKHGARYSETDLYNYGKWVGDRYKDLNDIIWLSINEATAPGVDNDKIRAVVNGLWGMGPLECCPQLERCFGLSRRLSHRLHGRPLEIGVAPVSEAGSRSEPDHERTVEFV